MKFCKGFLWLTGLLYLGCTPAPSLPSWVTHPPKDTTQYYFATAQAPSVTQATYEALGAIASKLGTLVQAQSTLTKTRHNNTYDTKATTTTKATSEAIQFTDYTITHQQKIGKSYWVAVRIDRIVHAQTIIKDLKQFMQEAQLIAKPPKGLKALGRIAQALSAMPSQQQKYQIAKSLDPNTPLQVQNDLTRLTQTLRALSDQATFAIVGDEPYRGLLEQSLQQNYTIATQAQINLQIKARIALDKALGRYIAIAHIALSNLVTKGACRFKISASSTISHDKAQAKLHGLFLERYAQESGCG